MSEFPLTLWRVELLHPLSVHFPLGILTCAVILFVAQAFTLKTRWASSVQFCSLLLLTCGVASGWAVLYTGELAEEVVNKVICDPTATHLHGDNAHWTVYAFTAALLIQAYLLFLQKRRTKPLPKRLRWAVQACVSVLMLAGLGGLLWTGHSGAALVYQQGAAVHRPSAECTEFE